MSKLIHPPVSLVVRRPFCESGNDPRRAAEVSDPRHRPWQARSKVSMQGQGGRKLDCRYNCCFGVNVRHRVLEKISNFKLSST